MAIAPQPDSPNGELTHNDYKNKVNEIIGVVNPIEAVNPIGRETYTKTDGGTYNLVAGQPSQQVGLNQSVTIDDPAKEEFDITNTLPFLRGAQNNSAVQFDLYIDYQGVNEQLLITGQYLISNDEASVQVDSNVVAGQILAPAGTYEIEMLLGASAGQGDISLLNGHNGQMAVMRTKHYKRAF